VLYITCSMDNIFHDHSNLATVMQKTLVVSALGIDVHTVTSRSTNMRQQFTRTSTDSTCPIEHPSSFPNIFWSPLVKCPRVSNLIKSLSLLVYNDYVLGRILHCCNHTTLVFTSLGARKSEMNLFGICFGIICGVMRTG